MSSFLLAVVILIALGVIAAMVLKGRNTSTETMRIGAFGRDEDEDAGSDTRWRSVGNPIVAAVTCFSTTAAADRTGAKNSASSRISSRR